MSDLIPCEHQVGGWHNGTQSCMLKAVKEGMILKPVKLNANTTYDPTFDPNTFIRNQNGDTKHTCNTRCRGLQCDKEVLIPVCRDELQFYQHLQTSTQTDDLALKSLIPEFHGCRNVITKDGSVTPHLVLEDLARGMQWPCVVDVKIGRTFAYPGKDHTKKYTTQEELGYCLTGLRVFHPHTGKVLTELRPNDCKQLTTSQVFHSLQTFCQVGQHISGDLRSAIASHLCQVRCWFLTQRTYKFRCGSILVVYDAAALASQHTVPSSTNSSSSSDSTSTSSINTANTVNTTSTSQSSENISTKTQSSTNATLKPQASENISSEMQPSVNISTETQSSVNTAVKPQSSINISTERKSPVSISDKSHGSSDTPTQLPPSLNTSVETRGQNPGISECTSSLYTSTESQTNQLLSLVKVKMIDFAHVLYSFGEKDENYIVGLENLISFFTDQSKESL